MSKSSFVLGQSNHEIHSNHEQSSEAVIWSAKHHPAGPFRMSRPLGPITRPCVLSSLVYEICSSLGHDDSVLLPQLTITATVITASNDICLAASGWMVVAREPTM